MFDILLNSGGLSETLARTYFRQLVEGVSASHERGDIHRDIKVSNLLLDQDFFIKITDSPFSTTKYDNKTVVGTPGYMAPCGTRELQVQATAASATWSCGVTLFTLFAGYPPYESQGDWWHKRLMADDHEMFWRGHEQMRQDFSPEFKDLVNKLLTKDTNKRITLAQVKRHPWYIKDVLSREDLKREFKSGTRGSWLKRRNEDHENALERLHKRLESKLATLGDDSPRLASTYHNMGAVYLQLGKHERALGMLHKSLKIKLTTLDEGHPSVAATHHIMGLVFSGQGSSERALEMYHKSLRTRLATLDEDHPDVATTYSSMGLAYFEQGRHEMALNAHDKCLRIRLATLGVDHPDVIATRRHMGLAYFEQGRHEMALSMSHRRLVAARRETRGRKGGSRNDSWSRGECKAA